MHDQSRELDCRGLKCPMPIVKIAQEAKSLSPGELMRVVASDPAFKADIHAWVKVTGNELVSFDAGATGQVAVVRKK